jgi:ParB/RepB/Spo0J family partition protein
MNKFTTIKKQVQIDEIMPNSWNPNVQDKAMFEKEKKSIQELGMLGSILVRDYFGKYQILDGEHRWKAAKELGYTEMTVETIGEISDQQTRFLTIHLNNLRGKDDVFKRAQIFKELEQGQLEMLPFTAEEIENEKQLITFDFAQYDKSSDLPTRTPGMLLVLPLNDEETQVWLKAKELLLARKSIGTDNTKKKQDIQTLMYLIKATFDVHLGANNETTSHSFEKIPVTEPVVQLPE